MSKPEAVAQDVQPGTPYEMMGGEVVVRRLVNRFYDIMESEPAARSLRQMHAQDLGPMRQLLFEFLSGWLGGPALYFQRPGHKCIRSAHLGYAIRQSESNQWMACMRQAMQDCSLDPSVVSMIEPPLTRMCEAFRNR